MMPGFLLHVGATVLCAHGGQAQPTVPNPRVVVERQPTVTMTAPYVVAGCPLSPAVAPTPCVTAQWVTGATRVTSNGQPLAPDRQPGGVRADRDAAHDRRDTDAGDGDMNIDFPFHFDNRGRTAPTGDDDHIRDLIEQLLFTSPGERVNRPTSEPACSSSCSRRTAPSWRPRCSSWCRERCSSTSATSSRWRPSRSTPWTPS